MPKPRVALLITCLVDVFEPDVADASVRLLEAAGYEVDVPLRQTCCGQPAWNSGFARDAAKVARTTLEALEGALEGGAEAVVAPAGSCVTMVRLFWPELFEHIDDAATAERARAVGARTYELTEHLAAMQRTGRLPALRLDDPVRAAWHHSCHMLRELHVHDEPLELLAAVDGCDHATWADDERCCGFGGLFSSKLPEASVAMADQKLASLPRGAVVVGADSSCLLHLRTRSESEGKPIRTRHVAELLADALPPDTAEPNLEAGA